MQKPGRLYLYNFAGGTLTQTGMFEETGKASTTAISWSPNGQYIYLTNANLHSSKEDNSVVVRSPVRRPRAVGPADGYDALNQDRVLGRPVVADSG